MTTSLSDAGGNAAEIPLNRGSISAEDLRQVAIDVNAQLQAAAVKGLAGLEVFDIIDLRMLSGLMGELFAAALASRDSRLLKNPDIDGYPDLCDVSSGHFEPSWSDYRDFPMGGIEVKNTFGVKKPGAVIPPRATRVGKINSTLVWKAHHRNTNRLLALQSDYAGLVPQIVAGYFSDQLCPSDWTVKAEPKAGSTMTSFCSTKSSAFRKLSSNELFRLDMQ